MLNTSAAGFHYHTVYRDKALDYGTGEVMGTRARRRGGAGRARFDATDPLHVAFAWWEALLDRNRAALDTLTHSPAAIGDYA